MTKKKTVAKKPVKSRLERAKRLIGQKTLHVILGSGSYLITQAEPGCTCVTPGIGFRPLKTNLPVGIVDKSVQPDIDWKKTGVEIHFQTPESIDLLIYQLSCLRMNYNKKFGPSSIALAK